MMTCEELIGELTAAGAADVDAGPVVHATRACIARWPRRSWATWTRGSREMMGDVQMLLRQRFSNAEPHYFSDLRIRFRRHRGGGDNTLEAGDECIVCVNGAFSERMAIIAERIPAKVIRVEAPYGRTVDPEDVLRAGKGKKIKFVGLTHGETSTGVVQRLEDYRKVADELGALLVVDAVATLGGVPLDVDRAAHRHLLQRIAEGHQRAAGHGADHGERARGRSDAARAKSPCRAGISILTPTMSYWGKERIYHHTPPISLIYGLREALRTRARRRSGSALGAPPAQSAGADRRTRSDGPRAFRYESGGPAGDGDGVNIPAGVDDAKVRRQLLDEFNIEIAGGLGPLKGKIWRIGLMGYSSQKPMCLLFLAALEKVLLDQGFRASGGRGRGRGDSDLPAFSQPAVAGARKVGELMAKATHLSNHSECGRDERIHRRLRCSVESDRFCL